MVFGLLFAMVTSVNTFRGLVVQTKMTNSITRAYVCVFYRWCFCWVVVLGCLVGLLLAYGILNEITLQKYIYIAHARMGHPTPPSIC